ncbi:MAG: aminotransferase class V-fold PLP-dependent enzyme [Fibrobacterota bacterium]|nr:aminotransferase class V-fold PLP-dependent enzyme [Fibrobacterota bacterium]
MEHPKSPDWDKIHSDFPVNEHLTWLNNCGTTPLGNPVRATVNRWLEEYGRRGAAATDFSYTGVKASIHLHLERLLNAHAGEFALVHHTAEGMNFISHGLSLDAGDEILLLENEYPSNVYPWEHWREKGILVRFMPMPARPEDVPAAFAAAAGPRTRVASLSAVHWCTGMPLPLEAIGRLCAERGIIWVVDGSQGVGLMDIDVKAAGIHYMAFSAWKWLLGPLGLGVLYISREHLESLRPIFKGTESVPHDNEYLPYKHGWKPSADRFAISTGSMTEWVYFDASLAYLADIGFDQVRDRIRFLAKRLSDGLRSSGFQIVSDAWGRESGIVAASRPGLDPALAVKALKARNIIAAERLGRIRLAPHVYISEKQIDKVVAELASL